MRTLTAGCLGILMVLTACCLSLLILEARCYILPPNSKLDSPFLCAMNWFIVRKSWLYRMSTSAGNSGAQGEASKSCICCEAYVKPYSRSSLP